jgi:transposase InsO family protein
MCSILLRFRTHPYALSTDIEKAFLHVRLNEQDRDFTRFLWLSNPSDPESPFITYRFKVVLFGSVSSPFMLNATLHYHLDNHNTTVTQDMKENLYVDNLISGCDTEAEAINYYDEARSIMSQGNFNLRSWSSNSPLLQARAADDSTDEKSESVNILGLQWKPTTDKLTLVENSGSFNPNAPTTKRKILQLSSKVYDPLGLLSPVTVRARILLQDLWRRKLPWDTPVDEGLQRTWSSIAEDIEESVKEYATLPRQYFSDSVKQEGNIHLHVFCDASTVAYGAVAFLQRENHTSFVMAKTRVAPLKTRTLPQLELMAALIGARLTHFIQNTLQKRFPNLSIHLWSDSQIVLHWLSSKKSLPQFVANRVKEIKLLCPASSWHYCPTSDNPADLLTRGITSNQLRSSTIWLHGPPWLTAESQWPSWTPKESTLLSTQTLVTITLPNTDAGRIPPSYQPGLHHIIDVSRETKLSKLIRRTAYILRFVNIYTKRNPPQSGPLTTQELQEAERQWIQNVQALTYGKEIANLRTKHDNRLPLVRQLRLFLDASGLLRCGGRIHNAPLSELTKFPYLLPAKHPFTELVIQDAHQNQLHAGVNSTVTALRQKFWIPTARQSVKKVLRCCVNCRKVVGTSYSAPDPAPLPKSRLQEVVPFKVTGVDFTGALFVNETDGSETKVYICLFTCATSRAIHLEIVTDLTEETFIQAFRRFASRKSLPKRMISDNASTYLSAADELKQLFQSPSLKKAFSDRGIEWEFIPKRAPWYGGFWERLIGMTKTVIKKVLGRARISLIALQTLVTEIEAVLNDRPLTYVSSDVNDPEPLTPAHLLYGRRMTSLPYPDVDDDDEVEDPDFMDDSEVRRRAKSQALRLKHFESRWRKEYLTSLREFHKSTGNNDQSVRVGDVVLIHSDKPRLLWRMAVIESLIRGKDGLVRAVNLRTSKGKTNRPITKLYPLELVDSEKSSDSPVEREVGDPKEIVSEIPKRPVREAAKKASQKISAWTETLRGPPEDVVN